MSKRERLWLRSAESLGYLICLMCPQVSKPLTRDIIHRELIRLGNVSFRHSYWFKHSKGIKIKIHRLKKKLRSKGYSKEDIKSM